MYICDIFMVEVMYFTGINFACYSPGDQCPDNKRYGNVHLCANKTRKVPSYLSTKLTNVIM